MILCRVLENDYQRLVSFRQRGLGVIGAWECMASLQASFLVSAASSAMPPRLIFFSVVLVCFHELYQSVKCTLSEYAFELSANNLARLDHWMQYSIACASLISSVKRQA